MRLILIFIVQAITPSYPSSLALHQLTHPPLQLPPNSLTYRSLSPQTFFDQLQILIYAITETIAALRWLYHGNTQQLRHTD